MDGNEGYNTNPEFIGDSSQNLPRHGDAPDVKQLQETDNEENDVIYEVDEDGHALEQQYIHVQGEDGQYYMMMDEHDDLIVQNQIQLVLDDTGEETVYVGSEEVFPTTSVVDKEDLVAINGQLKSSTIVADAEDIIDEDDPTQHRIFIEQLPQGLKSRKNRQYGNCRCPECGASFVNSARLERHLAVHQVFGSYLCPLCGKTFKYEYNLFYHWRKTCRDLNEIIQPEERQTMDVNAIRQLVEDIAQKKGEIGPIDIGISKSLLFQSGPLSRLEMPQNPLGRRGNACRACGVVVPSSHMARHLVLHQNGGPSPDDRSTAGGFFCDLCGLVFRHHFNLIKHWRTSCPEIQANLPENVELTLDDNQLRSMVCDLLRRAVTNPPISQNSNFDNGTHDENVPGTSQQIGDDVVVDDSVYGPSTSHHRPSTWQERDPGIVFADDFGEEDEMMVVGEDGQMHVAGSNRSKWVVGSGNGGVQCPECFRSFANAGRLERHLAGFHSNFGAHHCVLCGNRFKYEYNLLYHYRRSCPYTKSFIDRDVREQMDATTLRKLVRSLAQKEVRIAPHLKSESVRLMNMRRFHDHRTQKEMKPLPKNQSQVPPQLLQPRAGIPDARPCPICGVIFYGQNAVDRHIQAAHGMEPGDVRAIQQADADTMDMTKGSVGALRNDTEAIGEYNVGDEDDMESPPLLERQDPAHDPREASGSPALIRFVDQMGADIEGLAHVNYIELRNLIDNGGLTVGDHIIMQHNEDEVAFQMTDCITDDSDLKTVVLVPSQPQGYDSRADEEKANEDTPIAVGEEVVMDKSKMPFDEDVLIDEAQQNDV